jgi:hypothetical protein
MIGPNLTSVKQTAVSSIPLIIGWNLNVKEEKEAHDRFVASMQASHDNNTIQEAKKE